MRCGLWHDKTLDPPPKNRERKPSKPPRPLWKLVERSSPELKSSVRSESGAGLGWELGPSSGLCLCISAGESLADIPTTPTFRDSDLCLGPYASTHTSLVYRGLNIESWEGFIESSWLPLSLLRAQRMPHLPTFPATVLPPQSAHSQVFNMPLLLPLTPTIALTRAGVWVFVFLVTGEFPNKQKI